MNDSIIQKCICKKFTGKFECKRWERIVFQSMKLGNTQVKLTETKNKILLNITCPNGVLNLVAEPSLQRVIGNLILHGESVDTITSLSLWRFFEEIMTSFHTDALIYFSPESTVRFTFTNGILQSHQVQVAATSQIDQFLTEVRIDFLLEKLYIAMQNNRIDEMMQLKTELERIINQSLDLSIGS